LPSARSQAIFPFQKPRLEVVPDSLSTGGAVDGTKSPSTSGIPAPDNSTKNVFGEGSFAEGMVSLGSVIGAVVRGEDGGAIEECS
jgi:hypothetical protein